MKFINEKGILFLVLLWIIAPLSALALAALWLRASTADLQFLAQIFVVSEVVSLTLGWATYRWSTRLRIASIQMKIMLTFALGLVVTLINVLSGSFAMFLSAHDSGLLIVLLFFATLVVLGFGQLMSRSIIGNLEHLARSSAKFSTGDYSVRAHVTSGDEVEMVADAFNKMVESLEQARMREKEFDQARRSLIASVSHDLRTPLTSLRVMIEAINDGVITDEESVKRYLALAQTEIQNLSNLVDDLFELSQLDSGAQNWHKEPASLRDLISDTLETLRVQAQAKGIQLVGAVEPTIDPVSMNAFKMQRVLSNLVQNAIIYTPSGGSISVNAQRSGRQIQVDIIDTGEGIAPKDLPHIFEPFYRSEKSRSRNAGGAGLGLAIARGIVQAHDGTIGVTSQLGIGSRFFFTLPSN